MILLPEILINKIFLYLRHPTAQIILEYHNIYCFNGYDKYGYNNLGYDIQGYNRHGYDEYGECKWCFNTPCTCCGEYG